MFLSSRPAAPRAVAEALPAGVSDEPPAALPADFSHGFYVLVPTGLERAQRRSAALAAACRLAPHNRPAAIFVFEDGLVDGHILGEVACGRIGPQNYLGADVGRTVGDLLRQCEQVSLVMLDLPNGQLRRLGPAARRAVFIAGPDAESAVETYRALKAWRTGGAAEEAALLVVGCDGGDQAARVHRRLRKAAHGFLGCDLESQGFLAAAAMTEHAEPLRIFSKMPAAQVWPRLLGGGAAPVAEAEEPAAPAAPLAGPVAAAPAPAVPAVVSPVPAPAVAAAGSAESGVCPAFALWEPADRGELLAAIEKQAPALLAHRLVRVFRVDVDEPGAPPLAAVRDDGALVAILLPEPGEPVDTRAAERWLAVHGSLLARAYPAAGVSAGAAPSAIVLAPLRPDPETDGIRRFVPVRMGGHRGIVLLDRPA